MKKTSTVKVRKTYEKYKKRMWFSLENLADFMAEYYEDGPGEGWLFWKWLDKKARISDQELAALPLSKRKKRVK